MSKGSSAGLGRDFAGYLELDSRYISEITESPDLRLICARVDPHCSKLTLSSKKGFENGGRLEDQVRACFAEDRPVESTMWSASQILLPSFSYRMSKILT